MKKIIMLILIFNLFITNGAFAQTVVMNIDIKDTNELKGADTATPGVAGYITYRFVDGKVDTGAEYNVRGKTKEEVMLNAVKRMYENQNNIIEITHIDGVPIKDTQFAKYGGVKKIEGVKEPAIIVPDKITVVVNNEPVYFTDVEPFIRNSRTLVPIRAVLEHFNVQAEVIWNSIDKTVTATNRAGTTIVFTINDYKYEIIDKFGNKQIITNDVTPIIHEGRTMLPLRAIGEAFGFEVGWHQPTKVVDMKHNHSTNLKLMAKDNWKSYLEDFNKERK
jgi:hypothetical protein